MTSPPDFNTDTFKKALLSRQIALSSMADAAQRATRPVELDQARVGRLSRMDALQDQAMSIEINRRRAVEILRVIAALKRIEAGDFGYCLNCGESIPIGRLEIDPSAPLCVSCAETASR